MRNFFTVSFFRSTVPDLFFWIIVGLFSLSAGWIGGVQSSIHEGTSISPEQTSTVILQDQSRTSKPIENSLGDVVSSIGPSMFEIYEWKTGKEKIISIDGLPTAQQFLGFALAVTADGWLVTTAQLHTQKSYTLMSPDSETFTVTSVIHDTSQGIFFLHIAASNIKPIQFSKQSDANELSHAYIVKSRHVLQEIIVGQPEYRRPPTRNEYIHTSDRIDKLINPTLISQTFCEPVVRDRNEVVGCTSAVGIVPFRNLQQSVNALLKNGTLHRPKLSLSYVDVSTVPLNFSSKNLRGNGALIVTRQTLEARAVHGGIPIVFNPGDIITYVNDEQVDQNRNLSELIGQYEIGDRLEFVVDSGKRERNISFTLY